LSLAKTKYLAFNEKNKSNLGELKKAWNWIRTHANLPFTNNDDETVVKGAILTMDTLIE
jgi:hypothetical protein